MTRGETPQTKVHYKGNGDDFLVFIDDIDLYKKWQSDKSIPLAHFISTFKIYHTHGQGVQGTYDATPKAILDSEFGTTNEDDAIKFILEKGNAQTSEMPERQGPKNDSMGAMVAH